jgi:hypothetical protein
VTAAAHVPENVASGMARGLDPAALASNTVVYVN